MVLRAQTNAPAVDASTPAVPNTSGVANHRSGVTTSVSDGHTSDSGSYTSTLPDVFDLDMDGSEPEATGPWVAMDHLTGQTIVSDDNLVIPTPTTPQTGIEIGILPRLGIHTIVETEPPTRLFDDEEVRPEWLISAVKEFLRYTPFYGRLAEVIDLFLAQEARLGYPKLVMHSILHSIGTLLTTSSPFVKLFHPATGPLR